MLTLVVVCAIAIGLIIYYLIFFNFNKSDNNQNIIPIVKTPEATLITNAPPTSVTATTTAEPAPVNAPEDIVQQDAGQVAKIFVERFGTYSNQAGAEQFSDLKLFITAKMQAWVDGQVAKIIANLGDYKIAHIVRTQAVSSKVSSLNKSAGTATVVVSARRTDQTGDETPKISNPEIKLEMFKAGKRWQVDSVIWR